MVSIHFFNCNLVRQLYVCKIKNILLLIFFILFITKAKAQFPIQQVYDVPYYWYNDNHNRIMIKDSFIYEGGSCLQIRNILSGKTEYRWTNHSKLVMLLPYKYGNYIYLKDNSYIGVYDTLLSDYVNINTGPSAISNVNSIGISPNGNIWAGGYQKVGIFNGTSWQYYPYNGNGNVKVINDTSAYISGNPFIYFHNGVFDSLFTMPQNTYFRDWDVDSPGGLWIAGNRKLIHVQDTVVTYFDSTNAPIGTELFRKVVVGKNGHVWTCGDKGNLFESLKIRFSNIPNCSK